MNGILIINKEYGWTSHDIVAKLRGILGFKKIGHAGTLDPMATGILVLLLGKATKLSNKMIELEKTYFAEITLAAVSDTYDAEGKISKLEPKEKPSLEEIRDTLKTFEGEISQLPPIYSAKKIKGKKAYELARAGKEVKLDPKIVHVYKIYDLDYKYPVLKLRIDCGKGTYIRSIAHDLGEKLGTGAYLSALRREKVGDFSLEQAYSIEDISLEKINKQLQII